MPYPSIALQERVGNVIPILIRTEKYLEFRAVCDRTEDFGHLPAEYQEMITTAERLRDDAGLDSADEIEYFHAAAIRHRDNGEKTYSSLFDY